MRIDRFISGEVLGRLLDMLILVDSDGSILDASPSAERTYGYPHREFCALNVRDLRAPEAQADIHVQMAKARESGLSFETMHRRRDGSQFPVEVRSASVAADGETALLSVVTDISVRRAHEEELAAFALRNKALMLATSEGVHVLDAKGRLVEANAVFRDMLGYTQAESGSLEVTDWAIQFTSVQVLQKIAQLMETNGEFETVFRCKDGTLLDAHIVATSIVLGGQPYLYASARDVTQARALKRTLAERTIDLERSNEDLQRFAYVASHDLQEPLRMVASFTALLQKRYKGRLDSDADEYIEFAVDGARRMQVLIDELLDYARVGTRQVPLAETDLTVVLERVLRTMAPSIAECGATVSVDDMPTILCDASQVGRVFQNLIANALKFCADEPPEVSVGVQTVAGERIFSITDNGPGIEPQHFERIFAIFERLGSPGDVTGTGMGLAMCKRIVERHRGRIWVESQPGEGSTFLFTLEPLGGRT